MALILACGRERESGLDEVGERDMGDEGGHGIESRESDVL